MNKRYSLLIILLTIPFIFSCSSNGRGYNRAAFCSVLSDPLNVEKIKKISSKVEVKPGENFATPAEYLYAGSVIYVHDHSQDVKLVLSPFKNKEGAYEVGITCIGGRGVTKTMHEFQGDVVLITSMLIDSQNRTFVKTRKLHFSIKPNDHGKWIKNTVSEEDKDYVEHSPLDLFPGYKSVNQYFLILKRNNKLVNQFLTKLTANFHDDKSGKESDVEIRTLVVYGVKSNTEKKSE